MLTITIKIDPRTKRTLEILLSEQELGDCRKVFWTLAELDRTDERARVIIRERLGDRVILERDDMVRAMKAVTLPSLHVGGIYWYRDRAPPVQKETRMRAFRDEQGNVHCPRCNYELHSDDNKEEPVAHSKTLVNPRYVCPHCNAYVIVSSRKQDYEEFKNRSGTGISDV